MGWDYQLKNEPVFDLAYEHRHRLMLAGRREGWSADALPLGGLWLGNLMTQAQAGGFVRAGYHVPGDFGPVLIRGMGNLPPPRRDTPPPVHRRQGGEK